MLILALIIIVASKSKIHIIKGTLLKIKEHLMLNSRRSAGLVSGNMLHYNDVAKFASPFKRQPQLPISQKTPRVGSNCKCRWRIIAIGVHWYRYSFILVFMIALSILLSSVHANFLFCLSTGLLFLLRYSIKVVTKRNGVVLFFLQRLIKRFFEFGQSCGRSNTHKLTGGSNPAIYLWQHVAWTSLLLCSPFWSVWTAPLIFSIWILTQLSYLEKSRLIFFLYLSSTFRSQLLLYCLWNVEIVAHANMSNLGINFDISKTVLCQ